ncbi:NAD(P)-binding oxidoreductase [uncultured Cobetia sp.]|uniref:NAD(P)-binding oxidoreductase n=1 Tax=uncultured Cobetia sp. TaxID=410706 RepID=UPI002599CC1D|nr:NAD(P)-binding oxidoreductase [uncultured Cobetia sp.]
MRKTLIIGANGKIGRQLCEKAQAAGEPVVAMIRSTEQQSWFHERSIPTVLGDLEGEMRQAFYGCDQAVFVAGSGPNTGPDKTLTIDLHGAMRTAELAAEFGLSRVIQVSSIRSETPLAGPAAMRPYFAAKKAADLCLAESGLRHVIVKPGRLTNESGSGRLTQSADDSDEMQVSRANVAEFLLGLIKAREIGGRHRKAPIFTLFDGDTPVSGLLNATTTAD